MEREAKFAPCLAQRLQEPMGRIQPMGCRHGMLLTWTQPEPSGAAGGDKLGFSSSRSGASQPHEEIWMFLCALASPLASACLV